MLKTVRHFKDAPPVVANNLPVGVLSTDGEVRIKLTQAGSSEFNFNSQAKSKSQQSRGAHQPLMNPNELGDSAYMKDGNDYIYMASGRCVIKVPYSVNGAGITNEGSLRSVMDSICCHYKYRPGNADVKLVVSNEKLAEEYRDALADLARAVESPDPAHFRETLEEFRNRLRRDVGNGVKVLRGEFQDLRAKSARGVATLKTQSSAAAQKMRAGISHGVEQVKGGMRSMAELCGASSTIGQTISVVSVYVDETDQVKKERFISDFVF